MMLFIRKALRYLGFVKPAPVYPGIELRISAVGRPDSYGSTTLVQATSDSLHWVGRYGGAREGEWVDLLTVFPRNTMIRFEFRPVTLTVNGEPA